MPEELGKMLQAGYENKQFNFLSHTSVLLMFLQACINIVIKQNNKHKGNNSEWTLKHSWYLTLRLNFHYRIIEAFYVLLKK